MNTAILAVVLASASGSLLVGSWGWADLRAVPGVEAGQADWLQSHVALEDARRIVALVRRLSRPEAASLMAAYPHLDGSRAVLAPEALARLARRPPPGEAGIVDVLHTVAFTREETRARREQRAPGVFHDEFRGGPARVEAADLPANDVGLRLDFGPARLLISLLRDREADPARIRSVLDGPDFAGLLQHRSQDFYVPALTWEMLATNIALAGGGDPLAALYAEANPAAFYDFGDLRRHLERYEVLVDSLDGSREALASQVVARILPALPAGIRLERRVAFFFGAGADGWASSGIAAVDLEYFKDDVDALVRLLAHETYHAAQEALGPASGDDQSFAARALEALFAEGTATWVAAPRLLSEAERAEKVEEGRWLLEEIAAAQEKGEGVRARRALQEGTAGAGPLYWLGAAMTAAIAEAGAADDVAATLRGGPNAFAEAYRRAATRVRHPPLDPRLLERLRAAR